MLPHSFVYIYWTCLKDIPGGLGLKNLPANTGDVDSILGLEVPLEEEMATQSSILAWEIPWTEKPGRLQSMGPQKSLMKLTRANVFKLSSFAVTSSYINFLQRILENGPG